MQEIDNDLLNKANSFYKNKNYLKAYSIYKLLSEKGNSYAQNTLGYMFYNGLGVEKTLSKANYWWKKSALNNNSDSQYQLSYSLLDEGQTEEGLYWLTKSANNNHSEACYALGLKYYHGIDIEKNRIEAIRLFEIASIQGHPNASRALVQTIHKEYGTLSALKELLKIFFTRKLNL